MSDDLIADARKWCVNRVKLDGGLSDEVVFIRNLCNKIDKLNKDLDLTLQAFEHRLNQEEQKNGPAHRSE